LCAAIIGILVTVHVAGDAPLPWQYPSPGYQTYFQHVPFQNIVRRINHDAVNLIDGSFGEDIVHPDWKFLHNLNAHHWYIVDESFEGSSTDLSRFRVNTFFTVDARLAVFTDTSFVPVGNDKMTSSIKRWDQSLQTFLKR
jgi:hypothetical protein